MRIVVGDRWSCGLVLPNYTPDFVDDDRLVGQVDLLLEMNVRKLRGHVVIESRK